MSPPNEMLQHSIPVPDHFLPPTPLQPPATPLPSESFGINPPTPAVPDISASLSMQNESLLHPQTPGYVAPPTPVGLLAPATPLIPPQSPMYSTKTTYVPHTPASHLPHMEEIPQLQPDQLHSILDHENHPLMENMGYDHNNPMMANMGYDEQHPPAQTPGGVSEKGQATPWNEDYEFPNSAGPVSQIRIFITGYAFCFCLKLSRGLCCSRKSNKRMKHTSNSRRGFSTKGQHTCTIF